MFQKPATVNLQVYMKKTKKHLENVLATRFTLCDVDRCWSLQFLAAASESCPK